MSQCLRQIREEQQARALEKSCHQPSPFTPTQPFDPAWLLSQSVAAEWRLPQRFLNNVTQHRSSTWPQARRPPHLDPERLACVYDSAKFLIAGLEFQERTRVIPSPGFTDFGAKASNAEDGPALTQEDLVRLEQRVFSHINDEMDKLKDLLLGGPIPESIDSDEQEDVFACTCGHSGEPPTEHEVWCDLQHCDTMSIVRPGSGVVSRSVKDASRPDEQLGETLLPNNRAFSENGHGVVYAWGIIHGCDGWKLGSRWCNSRLV